MSTGILERREEAEGSAAAEPIGVAGKHSSDQPESTDADTITVAQIERLGETPDDPSVDMGYWPATDLARIIRAAYPIGSYDVTEWTGPKSQTRDFMAGLPAPDWRATSHWLVTKDADGHISQVDLHDEQERAMRELHGSLEDERAGLEVW